MGPDQGLAVDIFLEQAFAHHQAEIAPGPAPWLVGGLVDDVAEVVESAGVCGLAGAQPFFARLAAFPSLGGETQNFDFYAAALESADQDISTGCGYRYRA